MYDWINNVEDCILRLRRLCIDFITSKDHGTLDGFVKKDFFMGISRLIMVNYVNAYLSLPFYVYFTV